MNKVLFISGIDTNCGKTVITGLLYKYLLSQNRKVITQKPIQTGCENISEDILEHRKIANIELQNDDIEKRTCTYLLKHASSPHLAAKLEGVEITIAKIVEDTEFLLLKHELVLIEGAGGLFVPITEKIFTIDYIKQNNYPVILVSSSKLGSINHTLLSLEACRNKLIEVKALIYNTFPETNKIITLDSENFLKRYLEQNFPKTKFLTIPQITNSNLILNFDFLEL